MQFDLVSVGVIVSIALGIGGAVVAVTIYIFQRLSTVEKAATVAIDALRTAIGISVDHVRDEAEKARGSMGDKLRMLMEESVEAEGKARHGLANTMQMAVTDLERDQEQLHRTAVRKEELNAVESRLTGAVSKLDDLARKVESLSMREVPA